MEMDRIQEYKAKPVIVNAVQFSRINFLEVEKLIGKLACVTLGMDYVEIRNDDGDIFASLGDWIVLEQHGIFFKLTNTQFIEKYENILQQPGQPETRP
ncbi:MAG: hypothetical protein ACT6FG_00355 [Methanosarcinaceae archaeon]